MSYITDIQFLGQISSRIPGFEKKAKDVWACRCPYCGDSQKSKRKKRGYFFQHNGAILYKCFNCTLSVSLSHFIKDHAPDVYREYVLEKFKSNYKTKENVDITESFDYRPKFKDKEFDAAVKELPLIMSLDDNHPAKKYILSRKLPKNVLDNFFFVEDFHMWWKQIYPERANTDIKESRIIIAGFDEEKNIIGGTARAIDPNNPLRYFSLRPKSGTRTIFGLDRLNINKTVYVLEGAFDSFFVPNSIAIGSSSLHSVVELFPELDYVLVFDADYRNPEICGLMKKAIDKGFKVVVWDEKFTDEKDINAMVLTGIEPIDIFKHIKKNTFQGPEALLKFYRRKKI